MPRKTTLAAGLTIVLGLIGSRAQSSGPAPAGPAFKLTPCATCSMNSPSVAGTLSGKFLAGFAIQTPATVQARLFAATGVPVAAPFPVQVTATPQYDADVASNAAGAFVVAWSTTNSAAHNSDVWARRYDANGKAVGASLRVNVDPAGTPPLDTLPAVAMASDGSFTVAWLRIIPPAGSVPSTGFQVWARRFSAAAVPVGAAPVKLSSGLVEGGRPSVCMDTLKRAVVVWLADDELKPFEPSLIGVSMRRMNPAGAALGPQAVVAEAHSVSAHAAVACGLAGTFVVTWETDQPPATTSTDIVARRFTTNGQPNGAAFLVSSPADGDQRTPAITTDAAGNFVILWQDRMSGHAGIYGQRFSAAAAKLGPTFSVALANGTFSPPTLGKLSTVGSGSAFVAVWRESTGIVFGRRFKIVP